MHMHLDIILRKFMAVLLWLQWCSCLLTPPPFLGTWYATTEHNPFETDCTPVHNNRTETTTSSWCWTIFLHFCILPTIPTLCGLRNRDNWKFWTYVLNDFDELLWFLKIFSPPWLNGFKTMGIHTAALPNTFAIAS